MSARATKSELAARKADEALKQKYEAQLADDAWLATATPREIQEARRFIEHTFPKRERARRSAAEIRREKAKPVPAPTEPLNPVWVEYLSQPEELPENWYREWELNLTQLQRVSPGEAARVKAKLDERTTKLGVRAVEFKTQNQG